MTPAFGGELETLTVELNGRRRRITLERRGPWGAPLWLLLPALSTVSSRSEWQPLAEVVGDRRQLLSFDGTAAPAAAAGSPPSGPLCQRSLRERRSGLRHGSPLVAAADPHAPVPVPRGGGV